MKTSIFFLLSTLTATSAFAANTADRESNAIVELPAVQVDVARYDASEKSIQASLDEVRQTPAINPTETYRFAPSLEAFGGPIAISQNGTKTASTAEATQRELAQNGTLVARR
jgi:hypothetical protein